MTDEPDVISIPTSNFFPNRNGVKPKYVILHSTAGGTSAVAIANYFVSTEGGSNPVSTNYIIGQDGQIVQCVSESDAAYGNGILEAGHDPWWSPNLNPNLITISIEHCKPHTDNSDQLTDAQKASSFQLVKDICDRWGIPKRWADASGGITGHYSIEPLSRKDCPGPYPWDELFTFLQGGSTVISNSGTYGTGSADFNNWFAVDGSNWKCKQTNCVIMGANLDLYAQLSFDGNTLPVIGLPRTNELYQTEPDGYKWSVQFYERGVLVYDQAHKKDGQPGLEASFLGKYAQFMHLDPAYKPEPGPTVYKVPDAVINDIKQLSKDAGL